MSPSNSRLRRNSKSVISGMMTLAGPLSIRTNQARSSGFGRGWAIFPSGPVSSRSGLITEAFPIRGAILLDGLPDYWPHSFIIPRLIGQPSVQQRNRCVIPGFLRSQSLTSRGKFPDQRFGHEGPPCFARRIRPQWELYRTGAPDAPTCHGRINERSSWRSLHRTSEDLMRP
jgi:hypothetical protein